jgi:energy-coupling factor transport system substrate-specific component
MNRSQVLNIRDLMLIAVLGIAFGILAAYYATVDMMMISALGPLGSSITYGFFYVSAILAGYIVQKPLAALLCGVINGFGQALAGNPWGIITLIYGLLQGGGTEVGFLAFRYRRWDMWSMSAGAAVSAILTYIYEYFQYSYAQFSVGYQVAVLVVRIASGMVLGALLAWVLGRAIARTGVLSGFALGKAEAEARVIARESNP